MSTRSSQRFAFYMTFMFLADGFLSKQLLQVLEEDCANIVSVTIAQATVQMFCISVLLKQVVLLFI